MVRTDIAFVTAGAAGAAGVGAGERATGGEVSSEWRWAAGRAAPGVVPPHATTATTQISKERLGEFMSG